MLYPVEAEHDVHDRKSSSHLSIRLSFYRAHRASFQKAKCPKCPMQLAKAVGFPDGTITVPRWDITLAQAS